MPENVIFYIYGAVCYTLISLATVAGAFVVANNLYRRIYNRYFGLCPWDPDFKPATVPPGCGGYSRAKPGLSCYVFLLAVTCVGIAAWPLIVGAGLLRLIIGGSMRHAGQ